MDNKESNFAKCSVDCLKIHSTKIQPVEMMLKALAEKKTQKLKSSKHRVVDKMFAIHTGAATKPMSKEVITSYIS